MSYNVDIVAIAMHTSTISQVLMALLILVSVFSWSAIFRNVIRLNRVRSSNDLFESQFWGGKESLNSLYENAQTKNGQGGPLERIFESGLREYQKMVAIKNIAPTDVTSSAKGAMRASSHRESGHLETSISFLGTVGSVAPYVGLLGALWELLAQNAYVEVGTDDLSMPLKIGGSLLIGVIGLVVSLPATISNKHFFQDIRRIGLHHDAFIEEFTNILQRHVPRTQ